MTAAVAGLCLTGCKGKDNNNAAQGEADANATEQQVESQEATSANESAAGNLEDYYMVCPFCLQVKGQTDADGNPVTENRTWICGGSVGASKITDWVLYTQDPAFPFNKDGWHFVGKDIVNADETYKIVDEDATMELSSYCTVRTEKYEKPKKMETYEHATFKRVYSVDDAETDVPQLKTSGNRHQYTGRALEYVESKEMEEEVLTSFYLQEWVTLLFPAETLNQDLELALVRHQHQCNTYSLDNLPEKLWEGKPEADAETGMATATFYVSDEEPAGFYDLLFISNGKVQHYLSLIMTAEKKTEE